MIYHTKNDKALLQYDNKQTVEDIAIYSVAKKFRKDFLCRDYRIVNSTIGMIVREFERKHFDMLGNPYFVTINERDAK